MKEFFDRLDAKLDYLAGYVEWWALCLIAIPIFYFWVYLHDRKYPLQETCGKCGSIFDPLQEGTPFSYQKQMPLCDGCLGDKLRCWN